MDVPDKSAWSSFSSQGPMIHGRDQIRVTGSTYWPIPSGLTRQTWLEYSLLPVPMILKSMRCFNTKVDRFAYSVYTTRSDSWRQQRNHGGSDLVLPVGLQDYTWLPLPARTRQTTKRRGASQRIDIFSCRCRRISTRIYGRHSCCVVNKNDVGALIKVLFKK
jgi:hypothetical protein